MQLNKRKRQPVTPTFAKIYTGCQSDSTSSIKYTICTDIKCTPHGRAVLFSRSNRPIWAIQNKPTILTTVLRCNRIKQCQYLF